MDETLQKLIEECQRSLEEAAVNPKHPWRLLCCANRDLGGNPQSRYVVLRDVEPGAGKITFFTDQRSTKVPALNRHPNISLCFFDPLARLQLEVKATVTLHNGNDIARDCWDKTPWNSLQCYYMKESPGEKLEAPFILKADELDEAQAYRYFTVVECTSLSWDILVLKETGNQRASCAFNNDGKINRAIWVAP